MAHLTMLYSDARRAARLILGDKAELQEQRTPVYKCIVGIRVGGKFRPMGAGMNWEEALADLRKQKSGDA